MPSKKKKYNTRFPAGRIKKIMQSDEEVGKVAQAVPIIISRTVELFIESLLEKTLRITKSRNAKTLSPSHMKQCIMSESRFDFLRELVKDIPDMSVAEEAAQESDLSTPTTGDSIQQEPYNFSMPSTSCSVIVQPTTNGNSSLRNGIQTSTVNTMLSSNTRESPPTMSFTPKIEHRPELKRSWETAYTENQSSDSTYTSNNTVRANFYKESSVIQHTSEATDVSPPKLCRTDSAPPNIQYTNQNATGTVTKKPQRRLQHQSKSIPCTSKEAFQPPPIINIDVCNTPIVKIDYSNLALPDTESLDGSLNLIKGSSNSDSPIINIDLSKIATHVSTNPQTNNSLDLDEDYDNI